MKKTDHKPYIIHSISELHKLLELPKPKHPLVSVINFEVGGKSPAFAKPQGVGSKAAVQSGTFKLNQRTAHFVFKHNYPTFGYF